MVDAQDEHVFVVTAVELAERPSDASVAVKLTDARGGRVTLRMSPDMAELMRVELAMAKARPA